MRQSPLSDRGERAGAAAAIRVDEAAVCGARAEPAARTKAGADDEGDGGPIDEREAAMMRHLADVDDDWGDYDPEFDRRPTDPSQQEIRQRAQMLHDPTSRDAIGAWRRIASQKIIEKRFHGRPEAWRAPEVSDAVFYQRARPFTDE